MKKLLAKIIYYFNPSYFEDMSYDRLSKWGIEDIEDDYIIFNK